VPTLTIRGTGVSAEVRRGETILAALYRCGYAYRTGCKRGGCGICKLDLINGKVSYPVTVAATVLTEAERTGGTCLSCRAVPVTDVIVGLRDGDTLRCVAPFLAGLAQRGAGGNDEQGGH
jgi:ferredoxin